MKRAAPFLACLGLLVVWQFASLALKNDSFPTALEAIRAIPAILSDGDALVNFGASLRRMTVGFGVAIAVSMPLGLLMGRSRVVTSVFNPLLMVIYPVPKAALMPIIMLWLGIGDIAKTLVIFLGVSLPVIYHSFQGAKAVQAVDMFVPLITISLLGLILNGLLELLRSYLLRGFPQV